jgi:hypothetical protein
MSPGPSETYLTGFCEGSNDVSPSTLSAACGVGTMLLYIIQSTLAMQHNLWDHTVATVKKMTHGPWPEHGADVQQYC